MGARFCAITCSPDCAAPLAGEGAFARKGLGYLGGYGSHSSRGPSNELVARLHSTEMPYGANPASVMQLLYKAARAESLLSGPGGNALTA